MKGQKVLLTPIRQLGKKEIQPTMDLVFDSFQYRLLAYVGKKGVYLSQNVELRGGLLLATSAPYAGNDIKEKAEHEKMLQTYKPIFYSQLLHKHIYDEEGALLGIVGDVEIDLCQRKLSAIWLSGGIWEDLCFGRKRLDVVHLRNMQKEWEEQQ